MTMHLGYLILTVWLIKINININITTIQTLNSCGGGING